MKEIEKFLWLAALLIFGALASRFLIDLTPSFSSTQEEREAFMQYSLYLNVAAGYAPNIASAIWLGWAAKRDSLTFQPWAVFGLAAGLIGVAVFYTVRTYYQFRKDSSDS